MKKSLLALAVLGAFAGAAAAQSSLTIFGVVDANVGKDQGSDDKRVGQGAQSRLGFRGVEDIGNGLKATFHFQTRFDSGTGVNIGTPASDTNPFWQAEANVGLAGNFGNFRIGRQYTESFYHQIKTDPWGADTVATQYGIITGGVASTRANNSLSYWITQSGITFGVQVAEAQDNGRVGGSATGQSQADPGTVADDRPVNVRLEYAAGPLFAAVSYEDPGDTDDDWTLVSAFYDFGAYRVGGFFGTGTNTSARDREALGFSVTAPFGQGQARLGFAQLKGDVSATVTDALLRQRISLAYHYSLSKRTTIYGDIGNDKLDAVAGTLGANGKTSDTGYDFGIKHVV
jgi:predicted porin